MYRRKVFQSAVQIRGAQSKMCKISVAFVLCAFLVYCANARVLQKRDEQYYTTKYDNIDIKHIVASKRLMLNYTKCLLEKGPCTPEGKELKTYLPDAMATKCSKCSPRQKEISGIVLAHLVQNYPDLWNDLLNKYDADGSFRRQYEGSDEDDDEEEEEEEEDK